MSSSPPYFFRTGWCGLVLAASGTAWAADVGRIPWPEAVPGTFAPIPERIPGPEVPERALEPTPARMADCANVPALLRELGIRLTPDQARALDRDRLLLIPVEHTSLAERLPETEEDREWAFTSDEMLHAFHRLGGGLDPIDRKPENCRLVTPDIVLHAWHRGFARALEYVEERRLHPSLDAFLAGCRENARALRFRAGKDAAVAERLAWTEARFAAPWVVLGAAAGPDEPAFLDPDQPPPSPPPAYADAVASRLERAARGLPEPVADALRREVALVLAAEAQETSPLFGSYDPGKPADYTQFKPRSHYTKSDALGGYFRAMMFLGRHGYDFGSREAVPDALFAALAMARSGEDGSPLTAWKRIQEITAFFAGPSDDLGYPELRAWVAATLGAAELDPASILDPAVRERLEARIDALPRPRIVSAIHANEAVAPDQDAPSFRIFGQRFGWDARILDRLTRGAPADVPSLPTAAMVPAVFGDPHAEEVSRQFVSGNPRHAESFAARLPEIRRELAAVPEAEWFSSLAAKQLHVISTLARERTGNFPAFMTGDAFRRKNLESQLGSYTQLKHDTVLYAKQVYAEAGEGGDLDKAPPPAKGLVQPDVAFWRELERLTRFVADGFRRHDLVPDAAEEFSRYRVFADQVSELRRLAEQHLAGEALRDADWEFIRTVDFSEMARPLPPYDVPNPGDGKCALATDILTDSTSEQILFEALGRPFVMLALVGGAEGNRLTAGLAFRHFEFSGPLSAGRLTDEEWQAKVYVPRPDLPPRQPWLLPVTVPEPAPPPAD
jgi:hypothetical protein